MIVAFSSRRIKIIAFLFVALFFVLAFSSFAGNETALATKKKIKEQLSRVGDGCSPDDIVIYQAATPPLPNGIPTYTVQILNECIADNCRIGSIHLACGWFSSARLVNPRIFRRLKQDDCLVNDGRPIAGGQSVSFQYANSFRYPLSLSSAICL